MVGYEYKVIPAPAKGLKAPGLKGPEARFANALEHRINELANEGWEYQRSDILPSEERQGLTSTHIVYRSVLVFRRELIASPPHEAIAAVTPEVAMDDHDSEDGNADENVAAEPVKEDTEDAIKDKDKPD